MPEYSPFEIEKIRLDREVETLIRRDYEAYHHQRKVDKVSYPPRCKPKFPKKKPETRGTKNGEKRGPYKKRTLPSTTSLTSSKYYGSTP